MISWTMRGMGRTSLYAGRASRRHDELGLKGSGSGAGQSTDNLGNICEFEPEALHGMAALLIPCPNSCINSIVLVNLINS